MKKGDKITVVVDALDFESITGHAIDAEPTHLSIFRRGVVRTRAGGRVTYDWIRQWKQHGGYGKVGGTDTVAYADRGKLWARGWEGPEVDALKAVVALR